MGLPTLRGGFVGGDDHVLILNNVLVNHPSLEHAAKLFTVVHRDLYQPVPLLTFSCEFAIAQAFGLFDESLEGGAWLLHLTNTLLHALTAVLVWWSIMTWARSRQDEPTHPSWRQDLALHAPSIATITALLFAVHPLQVEVVSWLNGRMILLSTLFSLAAVIALAKMFEGRQWRWPVLVILFTALAGMSKVRVGLPVLLLALPLLKGVKRCRRFTVTWLIASALMGVLLVININATAEVGFFSQAEGELEGPFLARVVMALGWYFTHIVWPSGLAWWYPTPRAVSWSDPIVLQSLAVVLPVLAVMWLAAWRSRPAFLGVLWFFATIASTLPLIPARNLLAANRYLYLPIIGLFLLVALGVSQLLGWAGRRNHHWLKPLTVGVGAVVILAFILVSHRVAGYGESHLNERLRTAELFPDEPHVWQRAAWAYYELGEYDKAVEIARKDLQHGDPAVQSAVYQVIGASCLKQDKLTEALDALHKSVALDEDDAAARFRLGLALAKNNEMDEAIRQWRRAVEDNNGFNPAVLRLAHALRARGQPDEAREFYNLALENNPYQVSAILALAEMDMTAGTTESLQNARRRLVGLLDWMPENIDARANLGAVEATLGRAQEAIDAYRDVLRREPDHVAALINLIGLVLAQGDTAAAAPLLERAASHRLSFSETLAIHDAVLAVGGVPQALAMWDAQWRQGNTSPAVYVFREWARAVGGTTDSTETNSMVDSFPPPLTALRVATETMIAMNREDWMAAQESVERLAAPGPAFVEARRRFLQALEYFDRRNDATPWTYCFAARLVLADGRNDAATVSLKLCEDRCAKPECRDYARRVRAMIDEDRR